MERRGDGVEGSPSKRKLDARRLKKSLLQRSNHAKVGEPVPQRARASDHKFVRSSLVISVMDAVVAV